MSTEIDWATETWEVTAGCSKISEGCLNCYAARLSATRLKHHPDCVGLAVKRDGVEGESVQEILTSMFLPDYGWTGEVRLLPHNLDKPLHWRKPRRVFVDSRSDLFHESVPDEYIDAVFGVMALRPLQTFIVLTKRADRMREYMNGDDVHKRVEFEGKEIVRHSSLDWLTKVCLQAGEGKGWPVRNIWLGVTAENQEQADARIPHLLATPAAVRFVSVEPMLGPVDVSRWLKINWQCSKCHGLFSGRYQKVCPDCGTEEYWSGSHPFNSRNGRGLDWIVCGGESGPGARPMHPDWARSLKDQCVAADVPFFLKQMHVDGKLVHAPEIDDRVWQEYPNT